MEGLIIGRNFAFQNGLGLTIKTASTNSPWPYIREGLLSEGYLCLRFGGLICRRAYFFCGGGGGGLIIGILKHFIGLANTGETAERTHFSAPDWHTCSIGV